MNRKTRFLQEPWIPDSDIALAAVSGTYSEIAETLEKIGIETVRVPEYPAIAKPVRSHPDMLMQVWEEGKILVPPSFVKNLTKENSKLHRFSFIESQALFAEKYPYDVRLNALRIQNFLFCRPDAAAPELLHLCNECGIQIIPVRQGYARCSAAVIDRNSIITADSGIADAAQSCGLDVLMIRPGHILLPGYDYGFIGGCCGLIGKNKIAFIGKLKSHPDGERIRQWISQKGVSIWELTDGPLLDIGGIIPMLEYENPVSETRPL